MGQEILAKIGWLPEGAGYLEVGARGGAEVAVEVLLERGQVDDPDGGRGAAADGGGDRHLVAVLDGGDAVPLGVHRGGSARDGGRADTDGDALGVGVGEGELVAATAAPAPASTPTVTTPASTATRREPSQAARRPVLSGCVS